MNTSGLTCAVLLAGLRRAVLPADCHRAARPVDFRRAALGRMLMAAMLVVVAAIPARGATFQVSGTFRYEDRIWNKDGYTGAVQNLPIRYADVDIVNVNTSAVIGTGATNASGQFTVSANATGNVTLYVRDLARTNNSANYHITVSDDNVGAVVHAGTRRP